MDEAVERTATAYRLDEQVGFMLRQATQRHLAIFARTIPELTPTQFATLAKLAELGPLSQNRLGRETAMDGATIKGVTDRLIDRGLVTCRADCSDRRLRVIELTAEGERLFDRLAAGGLAVSDQTLAPLGRADRARLLALLAKIG